VKKILAIASLSFGALLIAVVAVYGLSAIRIGQEVEQLTDLTEVFPEESSRPAPLENVGAASKPMNILILGVDAGNTPVGNFENIRGRRSDTMIVVNIPGDRSAVTLLSLMRDLWVDIPGHRTDKLNSALSLGGVPMAVAAVEQLLDVRVDHVVMTDFEGLIGVADFFGGVDIANPVGFRSTHMEGKFFEAGQQTMTGEELLAFTRERYAFQDGDYRRVKNQRLALQSLAKTMASRIDPLAPWEIPSQVNKVGQFVAFDTTLTTTTMVRLALDLRSLDKSAIATATLPTRGVGASPGGQSIVLPDYDGIEKVSDAIKSDTLYREAIFLDDR
jgi:LCP family protein required for cell wall assembly